MTARINPETVASFELSVPAGDVEKFFHAVSWKLPKRPPSPPTLATLFRKGDFEALKKLGIPLEKVLHGEQEYRFHKPLEAGKTYAGVTLIKSRFEKQSGESRMDLYVLQTNLSDSAGTLCVECFTTVIVK